MSNFEKDFTAKMYMNVVTGSVATAQEWLNDQKEQGFPYSELESLVEVVRGEDGEWIEVK